MSIIPITSSASSPFPTFFLEARVHGSSLSESIIGLVGISWNAHRNADITIFTRASGTAVVFGVSSYVAYRFLRSCLSNEGRLFRLLNQLALDPLIDTRRLGGENDEGFYPIRYGEDRHESSIDQCLATLERRQTADEHRGRRSQSVVGRTGPSCIARKLKRLISTHLHDTGKGIVAFESGILRHSEFMQPCSSRSIVSRSSRINREDADDLESLSGLSNITSASRIGDRRTRRDLPPRQHFRSRSCSFDSSNNSGFTTRTPCSASFQLTFDDFIWDNDFLQDDRDSLYQPSESCCALSQLSALQNLERLFLERRDQEEENDDAAEIDRSRPRWRQKSVRTTDDAFSRVKRETRTDNSSSIVSSPGRRFDEEEDDELLFPERNNLQTGVLSNPNIYYQSVILQKSDLDQSDAASSISHRNSSRQTTPHKVGSGIHSPFRVPDLTQQMSNLRKSQSPMPSTSRPLQSRSSIKGSQLRPATNRASNKNSEMFDSMISSTSFASSANVRQFERQRREKRPKLGGGEESLWSLSPEDIVLMAANPNEKTPSLITPTNNADTMFDSAIVSDFHSNAGDDNQSLLSLSAIKSDLGTGKSTGIFTRLDRDRGDSLGRISEKSTPAKQFSSLQTSSASNDAFNSSVPNLERLE